VRAAEAAAVSTGAFVDANAEKCRAPEGFVGASFDDFVRTSADPRHPRATFAL
jgi:hypothetical protein